MIVEPTPEQKELMALCTHRVEFYITNEELADKVDLWAEWLDNQTVGKHFHTLGSSSWASGKRFIRFFFELERDAVLFKLATF